MGTSMYHSTQSRILYKHDTPDHQNVISLIKQIGLLATAIKSNLLRESKRIWEKKKTGARRFYICFELPAHMFQTPDRFY